MVTAVSIEREAADTDPLKKKPEIESKKKEKERYLKFDNRWRHIKIEASPVGHPSKVSVHCIPMFNPQIQTTPLTDRLHIFNLPKNRI